jgi:hypothetical protein
MPVFIDDVLTTLEVEQEQAQRNRDRASAEIRLIMKQTSEAGRSNLTAEDDARIADLFAARDKAKGDLSGIEHRLDLAHRAKAEEIEATEGQAAGTARSTGVALPTGGHRGTATVSVGRNERTYHRGFDRKGVVFLRDVAKAQILNDAEASHRLAEHMREERIERAGLEERAAGDSTTSNWAGLTVPQYLVEMYAPVVRAARPFADVCNPHDLPPNGMTINISQVTTGTSVALQTAELNAASATSIDDTLLTENVQTAAGQATLSRQALDRGTGIEEVTFQDMFKAYATNLDNTLLNQTVTGVSALATSGQIAYTSGSPTVAGLYPKILAGASAVEAALLAQAIPSHVIMHSRRWYWMQSQLTSTWPLIAGRDMPEQAGGVANPDSGYNKGLRGVLPSGLGVVVDNNVVSNLGGGTNQDEMYVVARDECHLWEDPNAPVFIRAEQAKAANLAVLMVLYGYFAYSFRRYAGAVQSIGGTGLVTPAF